MACRSRDKPSSNDAGGSPDPLKNSPGTLISRLFLSADSMTPTCMRELSHGPDGSVTLVKNIKGATEKNRYWNRAVSSTNIAQIRIHYIDYVTSPSQISNERIPIDDSSYGIIYHSFIFRIPSTLLKKETTTL